MSTTTLPVYERGQHWVRETREGCYVVYHSPLGQHHSRPCATYDHPSNPAMARARAVAECDRREAR